jgi:hypothetical protein
MAGLILRLVCAARNHPIEQPETVSMVLQRLTCRCGVRRTWSRKSKARTSA